MPDAKYGTIELTEADVRVTAPPSSQFFKFGTRTREQRFNWDEVRRVDGAIRDMVTFDVIDFYVFTDASPNGILLNDDMIGFDTFRDAAFKHWPEIVPGWIDLYSRPAFDQYRLTVWPAKAEST